MLTIQTFSPLVMHSFLTSIVLLSRIPRSITRASSMELMLGGPDSNSGLLNGKSSTPTIIVPSSCVSGYGVPTASLMPATTSVSPILTRALPSADLLDMPYSTVNGLRYSVNLRLSSLRSRSKSALMYSLVNVVML